MKDHVPVTKLIDHYDMEVSTPQNINIWPSSLISETDAILYVARFSGYDIHTEIKLNKNKMYITT